MRKLVLFGLLAGVFALALGLEQLFSRQAPKRDAAADDRMVVRMGGGPPREVPDEPPADAAARPRPRPERPAAGGAERSPEPARSPAPPRRTHRVAKDETLSSIARRELGSSARWKELANWNGIADPAALREGMTLHLAPPEGLGAPPPPAAHDPPPVAAAATPRTHKVVRGETLSKLAARYLGDATRWREIQRLNGIADPSSVTEGTTLRIPER